MVESMQLINLAYKLFCRDGLADHLRYDDIFLNLSSTGAPRLHLHYRKENDLILYKAVWEYGMVPQYTTDSSFLFGVKLYDYKMDWILKDKEMIFE